MSCLAIFGYLILGALVGILIANLSAAATHTDDTTKDSIIKSQGDIIDEISLKYVKVKAELHTYQLHSVDKGKYPIEGAD